MLERRFTAESVELGERFDKNFLDDVLDFALAPGVLAGCGKDARLIFGHKRLKAAGVARQHRFDQIRICRRLHSTASYNCNREGACYFERRRLGLTERTWSSSSCPCAWMCFCSSASRAAWERNFLP